jgi:hypothetical protein
VEICDGSVESACGPCAGCACPVEISTGTRALGVVRLIFHGLILDNGRNEDGVTGRLPGGEMIIKFFGRQLISQLLKTETATQ